MKTWGLFDKNGNPVAAGDAWYKWKCPQQEYMPTYDIDYFTEEQVFAGYVTVPCPFKPIAAKLDRCEKCGIEFRYP